MARFLSTLLACAALLLAGVRCTSAQGSCTSKGGAGCGGASGIQCCEGLFCDLIPAEAQTGTTAGFCKFNPQPPRTPPPQAQPPPPRSCTSKGGAGCGGASGIQCCEGLYCDLIPKEAQTGTTAGFCKFSTPGGR